MGVFPKKEAVRLIIPLGKPINLEASQSNRLVLRRREPSTVPAVRRLKKFPILRQFRHLSRIDLPYPVSCPFFPRLPPIDRRRHTYVGAEIHRKSFIALVTTALGNETHGQFSRD
jgi:hypothetical protein